MAGRGGSLFREPQRRGAAPAFDAGIVRGRHVKLNESRYHLFCRRYYNPRSRDSVASLYAEDIRRFGYAF